LAEAAELGTLGGEGVDMNDEGRRGHSAVAFSLVEGTRDDVFVFMDQLVLSESAGLRHRVWHHETFTTNLRVEKDKLENMSFSDEHLRGLGLMVMSALRSSYQDDLKLSPPGDRA
jgi:hypothetical protein